LTVFLRHGVNPLNGSSRVHECDMARHTDHGVKICIAIGGIVYTCKRGTNREQIKRLPMTSRENIWNTCVSVDASFPLTAETGNCRKRHGKHWAAFCSLVVSALSQHRWRYGRPISITYSTFSDGCGLPIMSLSWITTWPRIPR